MRTTLSIDEDVLRAAKALAAAQGRSIGSVVSELARKGLKPSAAIAYRDDFPVFDVHGDSTVFGPEEVRQALDDE